MLTENHKLVERHLGLARAIANRVHRIMGARLEIEELEAQALAGLSEAACRYNPDAETPFGLFAQYRIRGAIFDWLRTMGYLRRRRSRELLADSQSAGAGGPAQSSEQQAPAATAPPLAWCVTYLAMSEDDDRDGALSVLSTDPLADALLAEKHTQRFVARVLQRLPKRERSFLLKYYFEEKTMAEAGAELGLSRYQSCRLHARAMARLRETLTAEGFQRASDI